jgi:ankyrin repeat protein
MENYAAKAYDRSLTVQDVRDADLDRLVNDTYAYKSVLYWVCNGCSIVMVKAVLNKGVPFLDNVDPSTGRTKKNHYTPLMIAASRKRKDVVELLLSKGANVMVRRKDGTTALHVAADGNAPEELLKILIHAGADTYATNDYGKTPADFARHRNFTDVVTFLETYVVAPPKSANRIV